MDDKKEDIGTPEEAAKKLSQLGASKGGRARAKALTPEQRREIGRRAVEARWRKAGKLEEVPEARWGSPDRPLRIADLEIPCYVLGDERRVLYQSSMVSALGMSHGGSGSKGGDRLAKFVGQDRLKDFISNTLRERTVNPIKFRTPTGQLAYGYEATALADICEAVLAARKAGLLMKQQEHIAERCELLVRGFARVGIDALVDEVTGFQDSRAKDALAKILEAFIAKELRRWVSTFPIEYYKQVYRLRRWVFPDKETEQKKRTPLFGHITNDVVYDRLAPGVRAELHRLTPRDARGRLTRKLHQRLTEDLGHPKLREHLASVITLMRASDTWDQFMGMLNRSLPRYGDTPYLPFNE